MILGALPDWFGIPQANQHYIAYVATHPTYVALENNKPIGFLTPKQHYPQSAEIYVMAVLPAYHRQGIGRKLITALENDLRENGTIFLQVKTLDSAHPDEGYRRTRLFYLGMGFIPLESYDDLWGNGNPALQLVKIIDSPPFGNPTIDRWGGKRNNLLRFGL
jgi:ribosomal protein S18 acetylase RimI-like enzyme